MPSLLHEGLVALVKERPAFAGHLLRDLLDVPLPKFAGARLTDADFTEIIPAEYRSDAVVLFGGKKPAFGVIVEVQMEATARKRFTWPAYTTSARARFQCPFVLLVVTPNKATARWAAKKVDLGAGRLWHPLVIGPDGVPVVTNSKVATRKPELAVLSVTAHGRGNPARAVAIAAAAYAGVQHLPEDQRLLYLALIEAALSDAAKRMFEMRPEGHQFFSETVRRSIAQGEATGRAQGEADAVLRVLARRGLSVSDAQKNRVLSCTDIPTLESWLDKAVTASKAEELFEE